MGSFTMKKLLFVFILCAGCDILLPGDMPRHLQYQLSCDEQFINADLTDNILTVVSKVKEMNHENSEYLIKRGDKVVHIIEKDCK